MARTKGIGRPRGWARLTLSDGSTVEGCVRRRGAVYQVGVSPAFRTGVQEFTMGPLEPSVVSVEPLDAPVIVPFTPAEEAAADAEEAAEAAAAPERERAALTVEARALVEQLAAAERLRDIEGVPEADAEARRLRVELDQVKAQIEARSTR